MNKQIVLSLLIMSPVFTHAMESEYSFSSYFSLSSYLPEWFSFNYLFNGSKQISESKLISDLRASKNEFESTLLNDKHLKLVLKYPEALDGMFENIPNNPIRFLQYCYYQNFHEYIHQTDIIAWLQKRYETDILAWLQNIQIDGYSALGAAMLAKYTPIQKKRIFIIHKLLNHNFKPTPQDIGLAELILYDEIPAKQKEKIILLLCNHQEDNLSHVQPQALPQEIRAQIVQYMVQLFKNEFWLLPETEMNNL